MYVFYLSSFSYSEYLLSIDKWVTSRHLIFSIIMLDKSAITNSINLLKSNI
jgi:hypothetical protein